VKPWGGALFLLFFLTSCAGIQTRPTCQEEQFGIVDVHNFSDEYKFISIFRMIHNGERYKTVGEPYQRAIEPMTRGRIRISPGLILITVDKIEGERWMQAYQLATCATITLDIKNQVVFRDLPKINSRRGFKYKCPPCKPCPPNEQ
jgi:hypothetical protein